MMASSALRTFPNSGTTRVSPQCGIKGPLKCSSFLQMRKKKMKQLQFSGTFCSVNGQYNANDMSTPQNISENHGGTEENNASLGDKALSSNEILKKLRRYGLSGVLSYGILNTVYYLSTFVVVWFYVVPVPGKMGYVAAAKRFFKIMAMVWAGSQVTKLFRAGGALALAPFVDRGLSWFTVKFKFQSQGKAFMAIVGVCLGLAIALFLLVTLLWA